MLGRPHVDRPGLRLLLRKVLVAARGVQCHCRAGPRGHPRHHVAGHLRRCSRKARHLSDQCQRQQLLQRRQQRQQQVLLQEAGRRRGHHSVQDRRRPDVRKCWRRRPPMVRHVFKQRCQVQCQVLGQD